MDKEKQFEVMAALRAYAAEIAAQPVNDVRPSQAKAAYAEKVFRMATLVQSLDTKS